MRYYGRWSGRPQGTRENTALCVVSVMPPGRGVIARQCGRKRGHGPNGEYCNLHDPDVAAAREERKLERYRAQVALSAGVRLHDVEEIAEGLAALVRPILHGELSGDAQWNGQAAKLLRRLNGYRERLDNARKVVGGV